VRIIHTFFVSIHKLFLVSLLNLQITYRRRIQNVIQRACRRLVGFGENFAVVVCGLGSDEQCPFDSQTSWKGHDYLGGNI